MATVHPAQPTHNHLSTVDEGRRDQFLKKSIVAARLGMSIWTLKRLWAEGKGPRQRILSARVQGSTIGDIQDFLDRSIVT
jgi:hypothetical protein